MKRKRTTMDAVLTPVACQPGQGDGYWVNFDTVNRIRQSYPKSAKLQAVYYALNWIASDYKSRTIHVTHQQIGKLSGLSEYVVAKCLRQLADINVVAVESTKGVCAAVFEGLVRVTLEGELRLC